MIDDLVPVWGIALVLTALAVVASLLPRTSGWHRAGVLAVWTMSLASLVAAAVLTWSAATVGEDELYEAAERAGDLLQGQPGHVSQGRLAAVISDELGREVFAEYASHTAESYSYDVSPPHEESPTVCVRVDVSEGTATTVQSSSITVDRGACD